MEAELHPDEIEAVLHRHHVGRLACLVDGRPYVVPITYAYADGVVYAHTMPGRKLAAMRADPRVAFEVDERWGDLTWRSVVAEGTFEELTDEVERREALRHLAGTFPDVSRASGGGALFRLRLTGKTGRSVRRSSPARREANTGNPLEGIDLRAGDEANFPWRDEP